MMKNVYKIYKVLTTTCFLLFYMSVSAQRPVWGKFPELPDSLGFAGMFAGISKGHIFCMGGANFTDKKPWEGGKKSWYNKIFMFKEGSWTELHQTLPAQNGYGVSVSYNDKIILAGGNNQEGYSNQVISYEWDGKKLKMENYPNLPFPLSNMCGTLVGQLMIVCGGHSTPTSSPLNTCLALDLNDLKKGWFELDPIPGPGRLLPVCATYNGKYYVFSGETTLTNSAGEKYRYILQDAYCLAVVKSTDGYVSKWEKLAAMPKGISAGPSPAPYIPNTGFVFWGGVDGVTALWKDPAAHKGISAEVISYDPEKDSWNILQTPPVSPARVTLPVVNWNNQWIYISGEIRPGVRTNTNHSIR